MFARARVGLVALLLLTGAATGAAGCGKSSDRSKPRRSPEETPEHAPKSGKVTITSTPGSAAVISEGQRLGRTPLTVTRPAFARLRLQVVKEGFRPQRLSVFVEPDESKTVHARLRALRGKLLVRTGLFRGARLYVDGEDRGTVPSKVEVVAGRPLKLRLEKRGFETHTEVVTVSAGETRELDVYLVRQGQQAVPTGWLTVETSRPAMASADKLMLGQTPINRRRLPARRYVLTLRPAGAAAKTLTVRIKAGEEKRVKVTF